MWGRADDLRLRQEAMAWLAMRTNDGWHPIRSEELAEFAFDGAPFVLLDRQRGIRKPAQLDTALSIRATFRPEGAERPYADERGADGLINYKWRGTDPEHPENRGLRRAYERGPPPLLYFVGVGPAQYQAIYPLFIVAEEPDQHQFVLSPIEGVMPRSSDTASEEVLRQYVVTEARRRLHQPIFRGMVMRAYTERCAVCALAHPSLLDAAHIVPDRDERGIAAIRNGLPLCKIHHAAFDNNILGIRPDYRLAVRTDILHEIDGPMLRHGIQEMHGERLRVARSEKPDRGLLEERWAEFRAS